VLRFLLLPLFFYNVLVAGTYAYDKWQAKRGGRRVSEQTLLVMALAFGSVGALAGMQLARHKTRKWRFAVGVPFMLILQLAFVMLAKRP
jgi:uncharacterized membrane protein YsdA (DUF1294 family)